MRTHCRGWPKGVGKKYLVINQGGRMKQVIYNNGSAGAVYGLGFIGALVYFIGAAGSFGAGVLGVLKAVVWPAFSGVSGFCVLCPVGEA